MGTGLLAVSKLAAAGALGEWLGGRSLNVTCAGAVPRGLTTSGTRSRPSAVKSLAASRGCGIGPALLLLSVPMM